MLKVDKIYKKICLHMNVNRLLLVFLYLRVLYLEKYASISNLTPINIMASK